MRYIINIFKTSTALLIFICGIMIGQTAEEKYIRNEQQLMDESVIETKELLFFEEGRIAVYLDSIQKDTVNLIICNYGENKLQEVSIINMEIDGYKTNSYSYLGGICSGEIKKCAVAYEMQDERFEDGSEKSPERLCGELFVRGSQDYIYQKINIDLSAR